MDGGSSEWLQESLSTRARIITFAIPPALTKFKADPNKYLESGEDRSCAIVSAGVEYTCPMDPEVRQIGPGSCPKCGMALEPVHVAPLVKTEWTCPMHPEIVRSEPGSCPICGMALEPRTVTVEEDNPELRDMTRRFWTSRRTHVANSDVDGFGDASGQASSNVAWSAGARLGAVYFGDTSCALGWVAVLCQRLAIHRESAFEYVHADRPGDGRGLPLQCRRDTFARQLSRTLSVITTPALSLSISSRRL